MVPHDIPGTWLWDCVDEWHRLNPGQMASQMILKVTTAQSVTALVSESVSWSSIGCPTQYSGQCPDVSQTGSYALRQVSEPLPDAATVPRPAHDIPAAIGSGDIRSKGGNPSLFGWDVLPHFTCRPTSPDKTGARIEEVKEPIHQYAPRPVAKVSQTAALAQRKHKQAYITTAKIHDDKVVLDIYNCTMEIPITITQWELLLLAPKLHAQVTDATIKHHIPREMAQILIEEIDKDRNYHNKYAQNSHMPAAFTVVHTQHNNTDNLHNGYLNTLPKPSDQQEEVEVAAESNTLRTILLTVNSQAKIEVILDPGCQVITMSEEVYNGLAIAYNPSV